MSLYHCTHFKLKPGDLISPGNWGKKILEIGLRHSCWYREIILEAMRLQYFPNKPSRLDCTFSCDSLETIRFYNAKNCPNGYVYEVEIVDDSLPLHKGDFNAIEPMPGRKENMVQIANLYWKYELKTSIAGCPGMVCSEILTKSPLKVINVISGDRLML